ncbi:hypothetical protein SLA2020_245230 [Shorea laevis]
MNCESVAYRSFRPSEFEARGVRKLSRETTANGTSLAESVRKEDLVELDFTGSSPGQSYEWGCLAWLAWMTLAPFLSSSHTAPCWLRGAARLMAEAARWWFLRDQAQDKAMSWVALHGWLG